MSIPVRHHLRDLPRGRPLGLAAGFFDGVHLGHRRVIEAAVRRSRERGGVCWILSFDEHPRKLVRPGEAPPMLTHTAHKLRLFEELGAAGCLMLPFTPALAATPPEVFLERVRRAAPGWRLISSGADWRFGRNGAGDAALLAAFGRRHGIEVLTVPPVLRAGRPVSSTRIREAIAAGAMGRARDLLGRPFSVLGRVVRGGGVGRRLGFPTANLDPMNEVRPADGVYACRVRLPDGSLRPGVMNVGRRPTLQPAPRSVMEIHLIGYDGVLYGRTLEVFFIRRLRGERRFPSERALTERIGRDRAAARRILAVEKRREECFTKGNRVRYSDPPKQKMV